MKYVRKLKTGDTIGIFSPSSPISYTCPKRFERAKNFIELKGFKLTLGSLTDKHDFYRSGTIKERAEELNSLIRDPNVRCIMSTIGGMNSNSLLPYIDYQAFIKDPKIIIGYSDVTAILLPIYAQTGHWVFYGPSLVASFGEFSPLVDYTYTYFEDILIKNTDFPHKFNMPLSWSDEYLDWESQDRQKKSKR